MHPIDAALGAAIDAYRTCEFTTLGSGGRPLTWPTAASRNPDGTFLITTSLAFAQKALNVRRDGRVALLFSDPTGSGAPEAPQVFVSGTADCPEEIHTGPDEAAEYWRTMFRRQPHSRAFVRGPGRWFMDWYYLRFFITVKPEHVEVRPPLAHALDTRSQEDRSAGAAPGAPADIPGADLIARYPSAVLGAGDATRAPLLARVRPRITTDGFSIPATALEGAEPGRASLLVHRHDELLNGMHNALICGELVSRDDEWTLIPERVVEPSGSGGPRDAFRTLRTARRSTSRYLRARGLARPRVQWDRFQDLARPESTG
ncbi:pyridoxamine 5'-phosphate oxidase family protein [Streptomyces sp. WP-1]|uniref:pyridoxamine 5'-phosphate oxidase family protein n=1 Tax=Streptomyces sp. WP-1 TaxID=3041497 RepID=UPI00264993B2|nr:pyridoxamine 5'-phosphate oxidase family protein [Streptomyces sp. WP-1]WKE68505.1 pyridoxamine 5'-phosphate oxidase family protein [Streptomyces sp. WP-1]